MSLPYGMWPILIVPYNLHPWRCMKRNFIILSLLIPDPKAPSNETDIYIYIYMQPLVDELNEKWDNGVQTYTPKKRA